MAEEALAGGGVGVGVEEAAGGGIVISALQIIESSLLEVEAAKVAKNGLKFGVPGGAVPLRFLRFLWL